MKTYKQKKDDYYFFKLIFDNNPQNSNLIYRIEKNSNFKGFHSLKKSCLTLRTLKEQVLSYQTRDSSLEHLLTFIEERVQFYENLLNNNGLLFNKIIREEFNRFKRKTLQAVSRFNSSKAMTESLLFTNFKRDISQNIKLTIENIDLFVKTGEAFIKEESNNSFLFANVFIHNYNLDSLEVDLTSKILKNDNENTCLFIEVSQYFKNIYINEFRDSVDSLQQELVQLFYSFKKENVFNVINNLDLLFLKKNKLIQEHDVFYSVAPNFLISLIEKFRDSSKNIKNKIRIIKKYVYQIHYRDKTKYKFLLEKYVICFFSMNMEEFLSIKKHKFLEYLKRTRPPEEIPNIQLVLPFDYICEIYKDIISNLKLKLKLTCFPITKGHFSSNYDYFTLKREYYSNKQKFEQRLHIYSNHEFFNIINIHPLLRREYTSITLNRMEHKQKIPFDVKMNIIKDIYLIEYTLYGSKIA